MAGRESRVPVAVGLDGEPLPRLREIGKRPETAHEIAKIRLRGQAVRAVRVLEKVLKAGEDGGLTAAEYEASPRLWEFKRRVAETTLKLALLGDKPARVPVARKAGKSSAEAEPEDEGGIPEDFLSHLR